MKINILGTEYELDNGIKMVYHSMQMKELRNVKK